MKWVAALIVSLALASPAKANEQNLEVAKELVATMDVEKNFDAIFPILFSQITQALLQGNPESAEELKAMEPLILAKFSEKKTEIIAGVISIYADEFSHKELSAMNSFMKTAEGQAFIKKLPIVTQRSAVMGQKWGEKVGRELMLEMQSELQKQ